MKRLSASVTRTRATIKRATLTHHYTGTRTTAELNQALIVYGD